MHLDHIAVAVPNLEDAVKAWEDLGLEFDAEREVVEEQKVTVAFAAIDTHARLELLEPVNGGGAIGSFIDKKGPGVHHLCFKVEDIKARQKELTEKGFRFIYESPKTGAGGCLVNFIHPKSTGGVLVELSEGAEK